MLGFACRFPPPVRENRGWREAGSCLGVLRRAESELIKALKNLPQVFGKTEVYLLHFAWPRGNADAKAGGPRFARRVRRRLNPVGASVPQRREPPQSHHASAPLSEASRPDSARRPEGHACSGHTMQAICIAEAKKHSRDARAIRYARTYLALGASGVPPIDGAADASAG